MSEPMLSTDLSTLALSVAVFSVLAGGASLEQAVNSKPMVTDSTVVFSGFMVFIPKTLVNLNNRFEQPY